MDNGTGPARPRQKRLIVITGANALDPKAPHSHGTEQSKEWACETIAGIYGHFRKGVLVLLARHATGPETWAARLAVRHRLQLVEFAHDGRRHVNDYPSGLWHPQWHKDFEYVRREHRGLARNGAMMRAANFAAADGYAVEVHALASPWGKSPHMLHVATCARNAGFTVDMHFCPMIHSPASVAIAEEAKGREFARDRGPWVYFIRGSDGFVKIGWSTNVQQRIADLQVANAGQLELLLQIPGDWRDEQNMHALFDEYRMSGEWFRYGSRMKSFVWRASQRRQRGPITAADVRAVLAETAIAHPGG